MDEKKGTEEAWKKVMKELYNEYFREELTIVENVAKEDEVSQTTDEKEGTTLTDSSNLICIYRTQTVTERDDPYCIECWRMSLVNYRYGGSDLRSGSYPELGGSNSIARSFVDRDDCMDGNLKTAEEFGKGR